MKFLALSSLSVTGISALNAKVSTSEHPIVGVIQLLKDLKIQTKEESNTEANLFQEVQHYCVNYTTEFSEAIAKNKETIETQTELIEGYDAQVSELTSQIDALTDEITAIGNAKSEATRIRGEENTNHINSSGDLQTTIDKIGEAIQLIEDSKPTFIQKKNAVQAISALVSLDSKHSTELSSYLKAMQDPDPHTDRLPRVRDYDFKSGGVIGLLKVIIADFKDQLVKSELAEQRALDAHNLQEQARIAAETKATNTRTSLDGTRTSRTTSRSTAVGIRGGADADLTADTAALKQHEQSCRNKEQQWNQRLKIRNDEMKAISKAVAFLSEVAGVTDSAHDVSEHSRLNTISPLDPTTFIQMSKSDKTEKTEKRKEEEAKKKVAEMLKEVSNKTHSNALQKLANAVAMFGGPLDSIQQMIQKLIVRLNKEQIKEDEHKHWCDKETETSQDARDDKAASIGVLSGKIDAVGIEIQSLETDVDTLNGEIADIHTYIQVETDIRAENKAANKRVLADADAAQHAIAKAVVVLKQHYKESGAIVKEPWEFIQDPLVVQDPPVTWTNPYTSVQSDPAAAGSGVVAILEDIGQDYSLMAGNARAQEEQDEVDYQEDISTQKIMLAEKEKSNELKRAKIESLKQEEGSMSKQLKHYQNEHDAIEQYLADLQKPCHEGDSTYDERKGARAAEISALHTAKEILKNAFEDQGTVLAQVHF